MRIRVRPECARATFVVSRMLVAAVVLAACGGDGPIVTSCVVNSVSVTPPTATLLPGGTQPLAVSVNSSNCSTQPAVSWTTSAADIATVSTAGLVTAVASGSAIITATAGSASGTSLITVSPPPVATVNVTGTSSLAIGATTILTAVALSTSNVVLTGRTATWSSSNSQIATVNQAGLVTAVAAGTASIRATIDGVVGQLAVTVLPPLAITTSVPAAGAATVLIDAVIRITFSAAIDPTTVTATSVVLSTGGTVVPATRTVSGNVVTVTPSALLTEFNTGYSLQVTTAVKSTAAQALASNGSVAFTTDFWDPNFHYRITNQFSGPSKSLDTFANSRECFMGDTGNFSGQFWFFIARGTGGSYSMQNAFGGANFGLEGADTGTPCFLTGGGLPNEVTFSGMLWKALPIPGFAGQYYLRPASTTTKSLATVGLVPQLVVTPTTPSGSSSANWTFTRLGRR